MLRILVVDDEPMLLDCYTEHLQDLGHETLTATSGKEALSLLENNTVDGIISDWHMKDGDGVYLLKELRGRGDNTAFILCTGHSCSDELPFANYIIVQKPGFINAVDEILAKVV